jgi:hypothetical protein
MFVVVSAIKHPTQEINNKENLSKNIPIKYVDDNGIAKN